jgi:tetratricopeptide (TPR) repeat protein
LASWLGGPVAAADAGEGARLYAEGAELYVQRRFPEAAAAFRRAYEADPQSKYLYNQAQAERLAGDCAAAVPTYRRFLERDPPEEQRRQAEDNIAACGEVTAPPPPPVVVAPPPVAAPPPIAAPLPMQPPAPAEHPSAIADLPGGLLLAFGLAGAGAGAGLLGWSYALEADAEDPDAQRTRTYDDHVALLDRAEVARTTGAVILAAGGALLIGAVTRYLVVASGKSDASAAAPAVGWAF